MAKHKNLKRNLAVISLAILCCFLVTTAQPVQSVIGIDDILIIAAISLIAGIIVGYLVHPQDPIPPGVEPDSHLSLFYNAKLNEFKSLTVAMKDEASSLDAMGYYLGRKTEYAAMSYLNNTLYPTYPKWLILNNSIYPELASMWHILISGYSSVSNDAVRYAQDSFTGTLSDLDLEGDDTSLKTGAQDLSLVLSWAHHIDGYQTARNLTIGYIVVTNTSDFNWIETWGVGTDFLTTFYLEDQLSDNSTSWTNSANASHHIQSFLSKGIYKMIVFENSTNINNDYWWYFSTPCLMVWRDADTWDDFGSTKLYSPSRDALYAVLDFVDSVPASHYITLANETECYMDGALDSVDAAQGYASNLAYAYWTTLRNAGIYDISLIPPNMVIPLPDFGFISNDDLEDLTASEIMALYLAYLKALGNFFNSSTYQTILNTSFYYANVTFANIGVIVDGILYRDDVLITNGSLYIQIYADMDLVIGNNTLNSSGLIYNLNDTSCWSYAPGDILNITSIWVKDPDTQLYTSVSNVTIKATTVTAYLYGSESGEGAVPIHSGGSSGGGSTGALILIVIVAALILLARGKSSSDNPVNIIMPKSKAAKPRSGHIFKSQQFPSFFIFNNQ